MSKSVFKILLPVIGLIFLSSCAAVVVGGAAAGATYTYIKGWLTMDYNVSLKEAHRASIKALKHHDLRIVEKGRDVTVAFVKARGAKRDFRIRMRRKEKRITTVSVRVGVLGDRKAAKVLHETIRNFL